VYAIKPRLTSFGLGLLSAALRKRPLILEINDLENDIEKPSQGQRSQRGLPNPTEKNWGGNLREPSSPEWTRILDHFAMTHPSLTTHNRNLHHRYGHRATYLQNIKNSSVYFVKNRDRDALRKELGIKKVEKVLLFGGMVREHKGLTEVIKTCKKLVEDGFALRLLVTSSRKTPDLRKLQQNAPDFVEFMGAQNEARMAELNLVADCVVLWLDPAVPASHFQMPYKLTDALAMGAPVIANPISDLEFLGALGYVSLVPYGDSGKLIKEIELVGRHRETEEASRRLFERSFSFSSARASFNLALYRAVSNVDQVHELGLEFQQQFEKFRAGLSVSPSG